MRYFKHKDGFKDGTVHIKCSDDGRYTWLVHKNGSEMKATGCDLSYCLECVKRGDYLEIFLDGEKKMKDDIETVEVIVTLSLGRLLTKPEFEAVSKIEEVTSINLSLGNIKAVIPNKKASSLEIDLIKRKINRAIELAPYKKATENEATDICASVDKWFEDAPMTNMFGDCKGVSTRSVAEYIANQKNLTLFDLK